MARKYTFVAVIRCMVMKANTAALPLHMIAAVILNIYMSHESLKRVLGEGAEKIKVKKTNKC